MRFYQCSNMEQYSEKLGKSHGKMPVMVFIANQTPSFELTVKGLNHSFFGEKVWWNYVDQIFSKTSSTECFCSFEAFIRYYQGSDREHPRITAMRFREVVGCDLTNKNYSSHFLLHAFWNLSDQLFPKISSTECFCCLR